MNETSGSTVADSSGNGNNGTAYGTTIVDGFFGKARSFNGTSDYIDLPDGFANFTIGFTVEVWAYPTSTGSRARFIDFGNGAANNNIIFARSGTTADLTYEVYSGGTSGGKVTATGAITNNQWHYYAATEDASGNVKIYKDGVQLASGITAVPQNVTRVNNYIAKSNWAADAYYAGLIDEVRISNIARLAEEIRQAYEIGRRTHPITIDFVTSPYQTYSSGTTLYLNNPYGTSALTDTILFPPQNSQITIKWLDPNTTEDGYYIEKSVNGGAFANLYTTGANATFYTDNSVSGNNTYQYRIRVQYQSSSSDWCYTSTLNLGVGSFRFEGIKMEGVKID